LGLESSLAFQAREDSVTPGRQDILSEPEALPSGAEAPLGRSLSRRPVPPKMEAGLDLQQASPIDPYYQ